MWKNQSQSDTSKVNEGLRDGSEACCEYFDKVGEALEGKDSIRALTFPPRIVAVLRKTIDASSHDGSRQLCWEMCFSRGSGTQGKDQSGPKLVEGHHCLTSYHDYCDVPSEVRTQ